MFSAGQKTLNACRRHKKKRGSCWTFLEKVSRTVTVLSKQEKHRPSIFFLHICTTKSCSADLCCRKPCCKWLMRPLSQFCRQAAIRDCSGFEDLYGTRFKPHCTDDRLLGDGGEARRAALGDPLLGLECGASRRQHQYTFVLTNSPRAPLCQHSSAPSRR